MAKKKKEKLATKVEEAVASELSAGSDEETEAAAVEVMAEDTAPNYQAEAEQNKDLYLRALADLENYRKRALREKEDAIRFANSNLLREMIPVLDNLERAVEHADADSEQEQGLLEGVEMTLGQFRKTLESFGVKYFVSVGKVFDSNFHQAMGQVETDEQPANTVMQELQKGYTLNDRLLRPAMVMLAKAPEAETDAAAKSEAESNKKADTEN